MALALLWKEKGVRSQEALGNLLQDPAYAPRKGRRGIGHAGTLDPFAEGWLLVGVDEGTKFLSVFQGFEKEYQAEMLIGVTSKSLDTDEDMEFAGDPNFEKFLGPRENWDKKLSQFLESKIGTFDQIPPQFSAIRVGGSKRAYDYARKGETVELKARPATILEAQHLSVEVDSSTYAQPVVKWTFTVKVSSGTYIRSLARDWGQELLGSPGMLSGLIRTEIAGLGKSHKRSGVHYLSVEDLRSFFKLSPISFLEVDGLRNGGLWHARPSDRAELLLCPETMEVVAFTQTPNGNLGRVFLNDPLRI